MERVYGTPIAQPADDSLLWVSYVSGVYQSYIPLYLYSMFRTYPGHYARVYIQEKLQWRVREGIEQVRKLWEGFEVYENVEPTWAGVHNHRLWFLPQDCFRPFKYACYNHIDVLLTMWGQEPSALLQEHLRCMRLLQQPYNNAVALNASLEGLPELSHVHHAIEVEPYFAKMQPVLDQVVQEAPLQVWSAQNLAAPQDAPPGLPAALQLDFGRLQRTWRYPRLLLYYLVQRALGVAEAVRQRPVGHPPMVGVHFRRIRADETISAPQLRDGQIAMALGYLKDDLGRKLVALAERPIQSILQLAISRYEEAVAVGQSPSRTKAAVPFWSATASEAGPSQHKFVVLADARTGSTHLVSLLNSHPLVVCHREMLSPLQLEPEKIVLRTAAQVRDWLLTRVWVPSHNKQGAQTCGFKLLHEHLTPEVLEPLRELFLEQEVRIIFLRRLNVLDKILSRRLAEVTGEWISKTYPEVKVTIMPAELRRAYLDDLRDRLGYGALFAASPALSVTYEDLCAQQDPEMNKIWEFLGVHAFRATSRVSRQRVQERAKYIANYEALKESFAGTTLEWMFLE